MNDTPPEEIWFYIREGERHGPVSFADLKAMVATASLNPRLDMCWTQGMETWKPAGEINGLFERRAAPEPQESLSPAAGIYKPPQQESVEDFMSRQQEWPGAGRFGYLVAIGVFPFLWRLLTAAIAGVIISSFGTRIADVVLLAAAFVPLVVVIVYSLKRLVNLGMSRWWYLGHLVPFLNVWVGYRCFACPAGYAYHKKLDGPGIFLAIIYWLVLALCILAIAAIIAVLLGAIGTPQLQHQVRSAFQSFSDAMRAASHPPPPVKP